MADEDAVRKAAEVLALQLTLGSDNDSELLKAVLLVADEAEEVVAEFPEERGTGQS